jgi:tRNA(fMet)-specific endonuclease VapC
VAILLDTNVAIHLRDGDTAIAERLIARGTTMLISVVTLTELEAGVACDRSDANKRRLLLNAMLEDIAVLPFITAEAAASDRIIAARGFDRRRVLDRMIAAQAIVARLPLVTAQRHRLPRRARAHAGSVVIPTVTPRPSEARR